MKHSQNIVTVSSKYQIVIPQEARTSADIQPGDRLLVLSVNDRIEIVKLEKLSDLRGSAKGINSEFEREADRL